ncbi:MAG: hypothetical protein HOQ05_00180 [Corynebacteriales bacterium]|nr:hypothetical protein [Mycobacteriales bacterium]
MDTPSAPSPVEFARPGPDEIAGQLDAAVAQLNQLDNTPVAEHVAMYEDIHGVLQDALTRIDSDQR